MNSFMLWDFFTNSHVLIEIITSKFGTHLDRIAKSPQTVFSKFRKNTEENLSSAQL